MQRRGYLRAIGAGTIAWTSGCLFGAFGTHVFYLERVDDVAGFAAIQPSEFSASQQRLVEAAAAEEEAITRGHRPFDDGDYVEYRATYYRVTVADIGTEEAEHPVLIAEERKDADDAKPVTDLPSEDRGPAVHAARIATNSDGSDSRSAEAVGYVLRTEDESRWLPEPDPETIEYDGQTFDLRVESRVQAEHVYRTRLERVAGDTSEFVDLIEDELVVDLADHDLSSTQRDIVEAAIEEGRYAERGDLSQELNDLVSRLRREGPSERTLVKYEGEYYRWRFIHSD